MGIGVGMGVGVDLLELAGGVGGDRLPQYRADDVRAVVAQPRRLAVGIRPVRDDLPVRGAVLLRGRAAADRVLEEAMARVEPRVAHLGQGYG